MLHVQKHTATKYLLTLATPGKNVNAGLHISASVAKLNSAHAQNAAQTIAKPAVILPVKPAAILPAIPAAIMAITPIVPSLPYLNGVSGLRVESPLTNC